MEAQETISEPHIFWTKNNFAKKFNQNTVDGSFFPAPTRWVSEFSPYNFIGDFIHPNRPGLVDSLGFSTRINSLVGEISRGLGPEIGDSKAVGTQFFLYGLVTIGSMGLVDLYT